MRFNLWKKFQKITQKVVNVKLPKKQWVVVVDASHEMYEQEWDIFELDADAEGT